MIFLFDFLDIEPGSNIINYEFGSTKLNSSDYSFLGINVINDNINDNNYAIIISVNDKEKVFNIFKKVQFLKKENGQRKIYIICKIYNKKYKLFKSFINLFRVKKFILLSAILLKNPILFYKTNRNQFASNLIPDYPNVVTGEGTIHSFIIYLKKLVNNIISLYKIDFLVIEN